MQNSYTKLKDGTWGLRIFGPVSPGCTVEVATKAGAHKVETVGRVIWTGSGVALCTIVQGSNRTASTGRKTGGSRRTGCACGSREDSYGDLIHSDRNCASCEHDA